MSRRSGTHWLAYWESSRFVQAFVTGMVAVFGVPRALRHASLFRCRSKTAVLCHGDRQHTQ